MMQKHYDAVSIEKEMQQLWEENDIYSYRYDNQKQTYSIDTPPPTVSGQLHIGHIFSYTQAEIIARFKRMHGYNVFYPFGFDDNGLPTERLVEKEYHLLARNLSREEMTTKCTEVAQKYEHEFTSLWKSMGFSVDWNLQYETINPTTTRISQRLFLDLVKKGKAYTKEAPVLWCTECQTSIAQAELETVEKDTSFNYIPFEVDNEQLIVATTRPELLYGVVALFINSQDSRYKKYIGKKAITPLYKHEIPILGETPKTICKCGGTTFIPETAVMDTWATSSITPQINRKWHEHDERLELEIPMSLRTQAHEIIRTWAFYTIVRSLYHTGKLPWKDIMISGFVLAKKGEKISKSKNNGKLSPKTLITEHSADALRYWAANTKLGADTFFSESELMPSKRFMNKLWNASKFSFMHLQDFDKNLLLCKNKPHLLPADKWILERINQTMLTCTKLLDQYEIGLARHEIDDLFWKDFCDDYLEIVKDRLYKWVQKYNENQEEPFVGSGNLRRDDKAMRDMEKRLRDLEEENAILKKAMGIFAKDLK